MAFRRRGRFRGRTGRRGFSRRRRGRSFGRKRSMPLRRRIGIRM